MRITYGAINRNIQKTLMKRYGDLTKLQEQLSTGKRLLRPSDDPSDVSNDLKLRSKLKQLYQLNRNIDDGLAYMQITDTALMSMDDILQRLRELAIQGSSDTLSANERKFIASEVGQLLRQAISLTNTSFKGDYIFAGTQTKIMPFPVESSQASTAANYTNLEMAYYDASATAPGTPVQIYDAFTGDAITNIIPGTFNLSVAGTTYFEGTDFTIDYANGTITIDPTSPAAALLSADVLNGNIAGVPNYSLNGFQITFEYIGVGEDIYGNPVNNNGDVLREIENGVVVPINISADELLLDQETGINLLETIINLGQHLLQDNVTGINNTIGDIDISFGTLLAAQAKNGARVNRFDITLDRNESQTIETTRLQSELEDAELADTAMKFSITEMVYNAALQTAAKIIQPSLVNFL
jgi:flagellar hook-associated protein 3 FlgL